MTTEVFKRLQKFETALNTAINSHFARLTRTEVDELSDIVNEHRGSPLSNQERTCTRCFFRVLEQLAKDYFVFKKSPRAKMVDKPKEEQIDDKQINEENEV